MVPGIFHRDFAPTPYWWEAYTPTAGEPTDVPREARVAVVGAGYAGLSTALELAKHGIDAVVLEAGELGFGASTRNGGAVSGGVNIGKSFTRKTPDIDPDRVPRLLSDASDGFALIDRLIEEEKIDCSWEKPGRFVGAWAKRHFEWQSQRLAVLNASAQSGAYMCRASGSATRWQAITTSVAWSSSDRANCTQRSTTRVCSRRAAGVMLRCAPRRRFRASAEPVLDGGSRPAAVRCRPAMS